MGPEEIPQTRMVKRVSKWSDATNVESVVGLRPWNAQSAYIGTMASILGPDSLNRGKHVLEGSCQDKMVIWGYGFDASDFGQEWALQFAEGLLPKCGSVHVPAKQLLAGLELISSDTYRPGNTIIPLSALAKLLGAVCSWIGMSLKMSLEIKSMARLMKEVPGDRDYWRSASVALPSALNRIAWAEWECFWSGVATLRYHLEKVVSHPEFPSIPRDSVFHSYPVGHIQFVDLVDAGLGVALATTDASGEGGGVRTMGWSS